MLTMPNQYKTTSLSLAAYLSSVGEDCVTIAREQNSPNFSFVFDLSQEKFRELSNSFWSKQTNVDALTYFEVLRVLKSRIYQYKNQRESYGESTT